MILTKIRVYSVYKTVVIQTIEHKGVIKGRPRFTSFRTTIFLSTIGRIVFSLAYRKYAIVCETNFVSVKKFVSDIITAI